MPRTAIALNVLIASPSDVSGERDVVTSVARAWNADHYSTTGIMLNPLRWKTQSPPASHLDGFARVAASWTKQLLRHVLDDKPPLLFGDDAEDSLSNRRVIKKPRFLMRGDTSWAKDASGASCC